MRTHPLVSRMGYDSPEFIYFHIFFLLIFDLLARTAGGPGPAYEKSQRYQDRLLFALAAFPWGSMSNGIGYFIITRDWLRHQSRPFPLISGLSCLFFLLDCVDRSYV